MADLTATALLATARRRGWLPASPDAVSDDDLLAQMTSLTRLGLASLLKSVRGGYVSERATLAVTSAGAVLPAAASAQNLESVEWYDGSRHVRVPQLEPRAEADQHAASLPVGFYLLGPRLFVAPSAWSGTVRVTYQALPPTLVATSDAAQVASVTNATTLATSSTPSSWGTTLTLDVIRNAPGAEALYRSQAVSRASNVYTLTSTEGILAGDWLALEGESPLPQMPVELLELLALRAAADLAVQTGAPNAQGLQMLLAKAEGEALELLAPRGETSRAIVSRYAPGRFRGRGRVW